MSIAAKCKCGASTYCTGICKKPVECYFTPRKDSTSATICANCGKEKSLHIIGEGLKASIVEIHFDVIPNFCEEDLDNCWTHYKSYLVDILNGDYSLKAAREDLRGLIGSEFDKRKK